MMDGEPALIYHCANCGSISATMRAKCLGCGREAVLCRKCWPTFVGHDRKCAKLQKGEFMRMMRMPLPPREHEEIE